MKRIAFFICLAALLIGLLPVFSVIIASVIASITGCDLDEGSIHACMALGADIGPTLYTMFVLGWLGLITLPIAALGALGLLILGIIALIQKLRR
jgi:hypothetical protein